MSNAEFLEQVARGLVKISEPTLCQVGSTFYVWLSVLVDRSGSMSARCGRVNRLQAAKQAIMAMLDALQQVGADVHFSLIMFDDRAKLVLPFTCCAENRERINRAIRSIRIGGGTDLEAPLVLLKRNLPQVERVHAVLLSDGHGGDCTKAAETLKRQGVTIETVGVASSRSEVDESTLRTTASTVNRRVLYRFLSDADDLIEHFRTNITNRLVKQEEP